jgi:hypothetical protein
MIITPFFLPYHCIKCSKHLGFGPNPDVELLPLA